mgnify:CR=1 FL=1|jgi:hypothetical protein|tara:strand:- start:154 stop:411 length:258 start_codon:yes stop_codon:yes gene_type:complete
MHIITPVQEKREGAYAVVDESGEKVVFFFAERDDAERYVMMLECNGQTSEMEVVDIPDKAAIAACERTGTKYTIITKNELVIPVE